ncbi:hypothetical protein QYF36_018849 [Acer negundo]|nr:hypothetical protein QYF36_018849 [Acer negundo]
MDTAQWPQEIVVKPIEEILVTNSSSSCPKPPAGAERKAATRPQKDQLALNCPRCNSTNTKFCYYNNYSLTQPRYFCKTCRRYWTEGGSLRNIPVGGGSRKNKRSSSSSTTTSSSISASTSASSSAQAAARNNNINKLPDLVNPHHHHHNQNPKIHHHEDQGQDLNLAFPTGQQGFRSSISEFVQAPNVENNKNNSNHISSLELLTGMSSRGLNSFMPMPPVHHHHHHHNPDPTSNNNTGNYTTGLFPSMQDFKPTLSFSLDGLGSGYGSLQETNNGRLLFPFEDLKQVSSTAQHDIHDHQQNRDQQHNGDSSGYWTGMLGGGSW